MKRNSDRRQVKRRKPQYRIMRYRKNDLVHNVFVAMLRWIRANGGSVLVMGGIEVQDWGDGLLRYKCAVSCTGRKPIKKVEGK